MNFNLRFDSKHKILLVTFGKVATEEIVRDIHSVVARFVDAQGPCSGIADFTAVKSSALSVRSIRSLAELIPAIPDIPGALRVFVAPQPAVYGLSRLLQILREQQGIDIHVVHSLEEGYALLRVPSPDFEDVSVEPYRIQPASMP